jgi:hypothetical protein
MNKPAMLVGLVALFSCHGPDSCQIAPDADPIDAGLSLVEPSGLITGSPNWADLAPPIPVTLRNCELWPVSDAGAEKWDCCEGDLDDRGLCWMNTASFGIAASLATVTGAWPTGHVVVMGKKACTVLYPGTSVFHCCANGEMRDGRCCRVDGGVCL